MGKDCYKINLKTQLALGSLGFRSSLKSGRVLPEVTSAEERGLLSRTAAGYRAYTGFTCFGKCETVMFGTTRNSLV